MARAFMGAVGLWAMAALSSPALDLWVVRHAETVANVTDDYSVFNQRHFTALGEQQASNLTAALRGLVFDGIAVSPAYRAQRTIHPYLLENGVVAEIWPELDECCWQRGDARGASDTSATGPTVLVEQDMRPQFRIREGNDGQLPGLETRSEGIARARRAARMLRERYAGQPVRLLLVVHQHTGSYLLEALLDQAPEGRYRLANAAVTWLSEENGRLRLVAENLAPSDAAARLAVPADTP